MEQNINFDRIDHLVKFSIRKCTGIKEPYNLVDADMEIYRTENILAFIWI